MEGPIGLARWVACAAEVDLAALEANLIAGLDAGQRWVDPWAGNGVQSLGDVLYHDCSTLPPGATPPELVLWLRPSQDEVLGCSSPAYRPPALETAYGVKQGRLADTSLVNALGLLGATAHGRKQLSLVIASTQYAESHGLVTLRFWKDGRWVFVHIDDRIPCDPRGIPLYTCGVDANQAWLLMIEKGLAKLYGSYLNLEGLRVCEALRDLTGSVCRVSQPEAGAWDEVDAALRSSAPVAILGAMISEGRERRGDGLQRGWVYAVARIASFDGGLRLVKLVDPWCRSRWKGAWCARDSRWSDHPDAKEAFNPDDDWPENECYLEWSQFCDIFDKLFWAAQCSIDSAGWKHLAVPARFDANSVVTGSGGCPNAEVKWLSNPMLSFSVEDTASVAVVMSQWPDLRTVDFFDSVRQRGFRKRSQHDSSQNDSDAESRDDQDTEDGPEPGSGVVDGLEYDQSGLGLLILRLGPYQSGKGRLSRFEPDAVVANSGTQYYNAREVGCWATNLPKGDYTIVPSTFAPDCFGSFALDVYSRSDGQPIQFHEDIAPGSNLADLLEAKGGGHEADSDDDEERVATSKAGQPGRRLRFTADPDPTTCDCATDRAALEEAALHALVQHLFVGKTSAIAISLPELELPTRKSSQLEQLEQLQVKAEVGQSAPNSKRGEKPSPKSLVDSVADPGAADEQRPADGQQAAGSHLANPNAHAENPAPSAPELENKSDASGSHGAARSHTAQITNDVDQDPSAPVEADREADVQTSSPENDSQDGDSKPNEGVPDSNMEIASQSKDTEILALTGSTPATDAGSMQCGRPSSNDEGLEHSESPAETNDPSEGQPSGAHDEDTR